MLYKVDVQTHPGGTLIGSMGEYFYRERAEAVAKKHSWDMGPNFLVTVTTVKSDGRESRKSYRYGRVFSLRRT